MRIGFVCAWEPRQPEATWSGTPWKLREAMAPLTEVVDIDPGLPRAVRAALRLAYMRHLERGWSSTWKWSPLAEALTGARMRRRSERSGPDVLLQMGDYGVTSLPFYLYQDVSFRYMEANFEELAPYLWLDRSTLHRRAERQQGVYRQASGLLVMSDWMARAVVAAGEIAADKVVVVGAGISVAPPQGWRPEPRPSSDRHRLLFVGREFHRKGGDLVLRALELLRRDRGGHVTLTVAGPDHWPGEAVPEGVRFLGRVPPEQVGELFRSHDLFVLPSRFEPLGIAITEALAHGMPCVARRAFAMPERVAAGRNGDLVDDDDPASLAAAVARVLDDDALYERCRNDMEEVQTLHSWPAVAARVVAALEAGSR